jgi:hypothetical protein
MKISRSILASVLLATSSFSSVQLFAAVTAEPVTQMSQVRSTLHSGMSADDVFRLREKIVQARFDDDQKYLRGEKQNDDSQSLLSKIKSGDILLVRSTSLTGSIVSDSSEVPGQFSHLIFVVTDPLTNELKTVEADQGTGVVISKLELKTVDHWVRVGLFRFHDSAVAEAAGQKLLNQVSKSNIKYDNHLNLADNSSLYCTEVATLAFRTVGVEVPERISRIPFLNVQLLNHLNMESSLVFTPQDIEVDSRFSLVTEWRKTDELQSVYQNDAVFGKYFQWVLEKKESLEPSVMGNIISFVGKNLFLKKVADMIGEDASNKSDISNYLKYAVTMYSAVSSYKSLLSNQVKKKDTRYYTVNDYKEILEKSKNESKPRSN